MAYMEAVGRRVKADVKCGLAFVNHVPDFFFIGHLGNQAPGNEFFVNFHVTSPFPSMKLFIFPIVSRTKPQLKARWHTGPDEKTAKTPRGIHHG